MNCIEKEYKNIITRIGFSLLFFLLAFNLLSGGAEVISLLLREFDSSSDFIYIATDIGSTLAYIASFVLPVPFFYIISKNLPRHPMDLSLSLPSPHSGAKLALIVFAGVAVIVPMAYVNSILFPVTSDVALEVFDFDFSKPYKLVLSFISTAIAPAFVEELLFRGLIISNIKPYSKSAAVIMSAIAFGLMHQNPTQLLYATAAGFVLGLVYIETNSIWCCITLHFVNNFISVVQTYLLYILNEETANLLITFFDIAIVLIGLICVAVLLYLLKKKNKYKQIGVYGSFDAVRVEEKEGLNFLKLGVFTPTMLIFFILCVIQSVVNGVMLSVA